MASDRADSHFLETGVQKRTQASRARVGRIDSAVLIVWIGLRAAPVAIGEDCFLGEVMYWVIVTIIKPLTERLVVALIFLSTVAYRIYEIVSKA